MADNNLIYLPGAQSRGLKPSDVSGILGEAAKLQAAGLASQAKASAARNKALLDMSKDLLTTNQQEGIKGTMQFGVKMQNDYSNHIGGLLMRYKQTGDDKYLDQAYAAKAQYQNWIQNFNNFSEAMKNRMTSAGDKSIAPHINARNNYDFFNMSDGIQNGRISGQYNPDGTINMYIKGKDGMEYSMADALGTTMKPLVKMSTLEDDTKGFISNIKDSIQPSSDEKLAVQTGVVKTTTNKYFDANQLHSISNSINQWFKSSIIGLDSNGRLPEDANGEPVFNSKKAEDMYYGFFDKLSNDWLAKNPGSSIDKMPQNIEDKISGEALDQVKRTYASTVLSSMGITQKDQGDLISPVQTTLKAAQAKKASAAQAQYASQLDLAKERIRAFYIGDTHGSDIVGKKINTGWGSGSVSTYSPTKVNGLNSWVVSAKVDNGLPVTVTMDTQAGKVSQLVSMLKNEFPKVSEGELFHMATQMSQQMQSQAQNFQQFDVGQFQTELSKTIGSVQKTKDFVDLADKINQQIATSTGKKLDANGYFTIGGNQYKLQYNKGKWNEPRYITLVDGQGHPLNIADINGKPVDKITMKDIDLGRSNESSLVDRLVQGISAMSISGHGESVDDRSNENWKKFFSDANPDMPNMLNSLKTSLGNSGDKLTDQIAKDIITKVVKKPYWDWYENNKNNPAEIQRVAKLIAPFLNQ